MSTAHPNAQMMDYLLLVTAKAQAYVRERELPAADLVRLTSLYLELEEAVGLPHGEGTENG